MTGNPQLLIRIPDSIGPDLLADAHDRGCSVQEVILRVLHQHYGREEEFQPPRRGRPPVVETDD
jgi:hypothetical protein